MRLFLNGNKKRYLKRLQLLKRIMSVPSTLRKSGTKVNEIKATEKNLQSSHFSGSKNRFLRCKKEKPVSENR
jgi:hypothetical protein